MISHLSSAKLAKFAIVSVLLDLAMHNMTFDIENQSLVKFTYMSLHMLDFNVEDVTYYRCSNHMRQH